MYSYKKEISDFANTINLGQLTTEIKALNIQSAKFHGISQDDEIKEVIFCFDSEPIASDKLLVDGVVVSHVGKVCLKSRVDIVKEIFSSCTSQEQASRLLNALDKYPSFMAALDGENYPLAISRLLIALAANDITQEDYDLCVSKIPSS